MQLESDSLRRIQLRAVGALHAIISGERLDPALFQTEPLDVTFDSLRVSASRPFLQCLTSDVIRLAVKSGDPVEIPGDATSYYIAEPPRDEAGISIIELRKD